MPRSPRAKAQRCTLRRLPDETPVQPADVEQRDFEGELDVTGSFPRDSDANQFAALDRAKQNAFTYFSRKYRCIGDCGEDRLCRLKVKVLETKSAQLLTRVLPVDPDSVLGRRGVRERTVAILRIGINATVECACVERPVLREPARPLPPVATSPLSPAPATATLSLPWITLDGTVVWPD